MNNDEQPAEVYTCEMGNNVASEPFGASYNHLDDCSKRTKVDIGGFVVW